MWDGPWEEAVCVDCRAGLGLNVGEGMRLSGLSCWFGEMVPVVYVSLITDLVLLSSYIGLTNFHRAMY